MELYIIAGQMVPARQPSLGNFFPIMRIARTSSMLTSSRKEWRLFRPRLLPCEQVERCLEKSGRLPRVAYPLP
jgi:hypothetical protein